MPKRTEYRRWEQGQMVEELIITEEEGQNGEYTTNECGFRGDYGEPEEEEEDDEEEGEYRGAEAASV